MITGITESRRRELLSLAGYESTNPEFQAGLVEGQAARDGELQRRGLSLSRRALEMDRSTPVTRNDVMAAFKKMVDATPDQELENIHAALTNGGMINCEIGK